MARRHNICRLQHAGALITRRRLPCPMLTQDTAAPLLSSPFALGSTLTANPPESLAPVSVAALYQLVTTDAALARQVAELRQVRALDARAYTQLKLRLPYFVGATFAQGHRHQRNLLHVGAFVLDFDQLPAAGFSPEALREQLRADARV
jgi:hypothetical protein